MQAGDVGEVAAAKPCGDQTLALPGTVLVYTYCPCVTINGALGAPEVLLRLHPMRESSSRCWYLIKGAVPTHARRARAQCPEKNVLDLTKF